MNISASTRDHVIASYMQIRLLAGLALILGPAIVIATGFHLGYEMPPALSVYYHLEWRDLGVPGPLRTMFVCLLVIVGVLMIAYRGFDTMDNWIHNLGGLGSIGVAFFPMSCKNLGEEWQDPHFICREGWSPDLHFPSVVLMFAMAAYAVFRQGGPNLKNALPDDLRKKLIRNSWPSLGFMAIGLITYIAYWVKLAPQAHWATMFLEYTGFAGFGAHWLSMSYFIYRANKESSEGALPSSDDVGDLEQMVNREAKMSVSRRILIP